MNRCPRRRILLVLALMVAATGAATNKALADITYGGHGQYVWYPAASIDKNKKAPADPLQFVIMDRTYVGNLQPTEADGLDPQRTGKCNQYVHFYRCRVQLYFAGLWDGTMIPKKYKGGRNFYNHGKQDGPNAEGFDFLCANDRQTVSFVPPNWYSQLGIPRYADNGGAGSTRSHCSGNQYHMRFWTDYTHAQLQPTHEPLGSWVLAGVHHDKTIARFKFPKVLNHTPDVDWDQAADATLHAVGKLCQYRRWGIHPGTGHMYQGEHWSGRLARVTTVLTSHGCSGA